MSELDSQDEKWMKLALAQADIAEQHGEIPVGAILVANEEVVAVGYNHSIHQNNPCGHAEIMALKAGAEAVNNYRLIDCTLYVTLEPCPMCAGAIIHSRVKRVVYGAADLKTGAVDSVLNLLSDTRFNHQPEVTAGILADVCSAKISDFFKRRRAEKKKLKGERLEES